MASFLHIYRPLPFSMPWPIQPRLPEPVKFALENCANRFPAHPESAHMSPVCPGLIGLDERCVAYRLWEMFVFSLCACLLSWEDDPGDLLLLTVSIYGDEAGGSMPDSLSPPPTI